MEAYNLRRLEAADEPLLLHALSARPCAGFPSPAADHYESPISLDALLELRAPHMWLADTEGDSMRELGIFHGSKLVINRKQEAAPGDVVVVYLDNQPMVKLLDRIGGQLALLSANPKYPPRFPAEGEDVEVFGVVQWSLTYHGR